MTRIRTLGVLAMLIALIASSELGARAVESRLPPPPGWPTREYGMKVREIDRLARGRGAGVVVVGSSVVDVSISADKLASPDRRIGYNASILGSTPDAVSLWTEDVLLPRLRPNIVVIGVSSRDLMDQGALSKRWEQQLLTSPAMQAIRHDESLSDRVERLLDDHSALLRNRVALRRPFDALGFRRGKDPQLQVSSSGMNTVLFGNRLRAPARPNPELLETVSLTAISSLERLIGRLEAVGVRVVLLDVPVSTTYIGRRHTTVAAYDHYRSEVLALAKRSGAALLSPGVWTDDMFADPLHVNEIGGRILTALLRDFISTAVAAPAIAGAPAPPPSMTGPRGESATPTPPASEVAPTGTDETADCGPSTPHTPVDPDVPPAPVDTDGMVPCDHVVDPQAPPLPIGP